MRPWWHSIEEALLLLESYRSLVPCAFHLVNSKTLRFSNIDQGSPQPISWPYYMVQGLLDMRYQLYLSLWSKSFYSVILWVLFRYLMHCLRSFDQHFYHFCHRRFSCSFNERPFNIPFHNCLENTFGITRGDSDQKVSHGPCIRCTRWNTVCSDSLRFVQPARGLLGLDDAVYRWIKGDKRLIGFLTGRYVPEIPPVLLIDHFLVDLFVENPPNDYLPANDR